MPITSPPMISSVPLPVSPIVTLVLSSHVFGSLGSTSPVTITAARAGMAVSPTNTNTDTTDKLMRIGTPAHVNSQIPCVGLFVQTRSIDNFVHVGGGTGFGQAATEVRFFVAASVNTATGTQEMMLDSDGLNILDDLDMGGDLTLDGTGSGSGDLTMAGDLTVQGTNMLMTIATPFFRMGDGTAGSDFEMRKATADTNTLRFAVGSTLNMRIVHDANEDFLFEAFDGVPVLTSTTIWRNADGDWEFPNNVDLDGDLTLDGSVGNGDLTMAGDLVVDLSMTVGDLTGSTTNFRLKSDAGNYAENYNVDSTASAGRRWIFNFNSAENLFWSRRDAGGAGVDTPLTLNWTDGSVLIANVLEIDGDLNHDGSRVGFYGTSPASQSAAYTINATAVPDRTLLESSAATATNNNNVLAALIADLQLTGILG